MTHKIRLRENTRITAKKASRWPEMEADLKVDTQDGREDILVQGPTLTKCFSYKSRRIGSTPLKFGIILKLLRYVIKLAWSDEFVYSMMSTTRASKVSRYYSMLTLLTTKLDQYT